MLQAIPYHPHLHDAELPEHSRCRCPASTARPSRPMTTGLRAVWSAWRESLAVHGQYEQLRSRGLSHDAALRQALAIGPAPTACASAKPLHFAGRA